MFNPCGEFRRAQLTKSTVLAPTLVPLGSFQMPKREWVAESNGKLPHLFIPSKTATLVPNFAVEDLPFGRTAALVPEFAVKDLLSGRTLHDDVGTLIQIHNLPPSNPF